MQTAGLKEVQFEMADGGSDWQFPYRLLVPGMTAWGENDRIVLGMTPDAYPYGCTDYGFRPGYSGPLPDFWLSPFYFASSDDSDGVVLLIDPNLISITVPYHIMRRLGPGTTTVGVQYRPKDADRRNTLLTGRLPIKFGGI